jgi:tyrosinase
LVTFVLLAVYVQGDAVGDLQTKGRAAVDAAIVKSTTCTKDKVRVRKEWYVPQN